MKIEFDNEGDRYSCDLGAGIQLARPVRFAAPESNPWEVHPPSKIPVRSNGFVGSTQDGGSCNVDQLSLIPHCHGTHTETIGHIVDRDCFISDLSIPSLVPAVMVSVPVVAADSTSDTYQPSFGKHDQVISAKSLEGELGKWKGFAATALIVRAGSSEAFFTNEAMVAIVECGIQHLLVDFPSVDRLEDDGLLSNHRIFWDIDAGSKEVTPTSRFNHTITELVSVPEGVTDGPCLLSIQVPAIDSDAAPSRPVAYPITRV